MEIILAILIAPVQEADLNRFPPPEVVKQALAQGYAHEAYLKHMQAWRGNREFYFWQAEIAANNLRWQAWDILRSAQACQQENCGQPSEWAYEQMLKHLEGLQEFLGVDHYTQGWMPEPVLARE